MMWALRLMFCILTALGLLASVAAHVSTYFGVNPEAVFPPLLSLHLGIFLVGLPAFLLATPRTRGGEQQDNHPWQDSPPWMIALAMCFFAYAFVNGVLFMLWVEGSTGTRPEDGTYYLHSHGRFIRDISEEEYHYHEICKWRGVSGVWMVFYSWALTAILPRVWTGIARARPPESEGVNRDNSAPVDR